MIPLDEARRHVFDRVSAAAAMSVEIEAAAGLVLAEPVVSSEAVPPFANTAMDGFAVRSVDTAPAPVSLEVVATIAAGDAPTVEVGAGQAVRIMTGAPMPYGADAVVMVERTNFDEACGRVEVQVAVEAGNHVRHAGEDVKVGDEVFGASTLLGPGHVGVLASIGVFEVTAIPRPRVGVISTGDELVDGPAALAPGQIRDSNRRTLLAMLADDGFEPVDLGLVADDEQAITAAFTRGAASCDALLSTGGVSMGAFDLVKVVLDRMGEMRWMQIAIKPAKPFAFGLVDGTPVFGLPGNPVSSMVSYEVLAKPALRTIAGRDPALSTVAATSDDSLGHGSDGKTHFVRVTGERDRSGRWTVRRAGGQGSHQLTAMARADALAVVPDGATIEPGDDVDIIELTHPAASA